ncbi:TadE/TadG family type IV pilus assembly protein [Syntrophomonas palmitatica]|uniref:TadE/TadG family type IV pilus assembly protein n=1 Tax=Syntrophomonas palmitatica TaxID=402877 RepID=UPI0006D17030|nr:TadE family protein [Syntrophomonas palmitatica]
MKYLSGVLKKEKAQALVELALVLPILILLFTGICESGKIIGTYLLISNLAREGARYGAVGHTDQEIQNRINEQRSWLEQGRMEIRISPTSTDRSMGETLRVGINYRSDLMTPLFASILPNPVLLSAECSMRME